MSEIDDILKEVESFKTEEQNFEEAIRQMEQPPAEAPVQPAEEKEAPKPLTEPLPVQPPPDKPKIPERTKKHRKKSCIIGTFSAVLFLIVMGIAMIISLFSPVGILNAAKITPIILVFLGLEILLNLVLRKNISFALDFKSLILCGGIVIFTFLVSLVSLATSTEYNDRYYAEKRIENEIGAQFFEYLGTDANIKSVDIDLEIENTDVSGYKTADDIKNTDSLFIKVNFETSQRSVMQFASDCHEILGQLAETDYLFKTITFEADDNINHFSAELDGMYQLDLTVQQIMQITNFFGSYIEDDVTDVTE